MINAPRILTIVRSALTIAALIWIGDFFLRHRIELVGAIASLDMRVVGGAMVFVLIGLVPGALAWQWLLSRDLPTVPTARGILVYLRSGIGKYTPGGVLAFAIQHRLLESEGAGVALLVRVFAGTALAACLAASLVGLPAAAPLIGSGLSYWIVLVFFCVIGAMILTCRAGRWPVFPDALDRIGVPPPLPFVTTTALMAGAWVVTGTHLAMLGVATEAGAVFLISAYAFSAIAGIVFAVLPGAFGVRDGVLLLILTTRLDPGDAMALALLSRAMIVAGDVIGAVVAALALGQAATESRVERSLP